MSNKKQTARSARIGKLPTRHHFLLNPHPDLRCTTCPHCDGKALLRKFYLFIGVEGANPFTLGMTCRFCPACELIICHQNDLESLLAGTFQRLNPSVIGNKYLVIGTMERAAFRRGLTGDLSMNEALENLADFKEYYDLEYQPRGWYLAT